MEFLPALAMTALVVKFIDFLRYLFNRDTNGVITQLTVWAGGVAAIVLVAQTDWADSIPIGDMALGKLGFWSLVFVGLTVGSISSLTKDTLKSVDNHNSSKIPTLLPTGPKPPVDGVG